MILWLNLSLLMSLCFWALTLTSISWFFFYLPMWEKMAKWGCSGKNAFPWAGIRLWYAFAMESALGIFGNDCSSLFCVRIVKESFSDPQLEKLGWRTVSRILLRQNPLKYRDPLKLHPEGVSRFQATLHLASNNSSKLPFKWSYQFMASEAFTLGKQTLVWVFGFTCL